MQWQHRIFKKARRMRHFWAFGLSLKEHCFHQFESNLKNRYYEYALDFCGYFISSCVSMFSFFIFISYLFCKRTVLLFLEKQWLYTHLYISTVTCFHFCDFLCIVPYFRGNSLNSRAGLEFKKFRLFSTINFQTKNEIPWFVFSKNRCGKKTKPIRIKKNPLNVFCFLKNHRGTKLKFLKFKDVQGQPLDLRNVRRKNEKEHGKNT